MNVQVYSLSHYAYILAMNYIIQRVSETIYKSCSRSVMYVDYCHQSLFFKCRYLTRILKRQSVNLNFFCVLDIETASKVTSTVLLVVCYSRGQFE